LALWEHTTILKARLEKFQNNPDENFVTSRNDINRIFKFLKALEEAEPDLNGLMEPVVKALSNAIYVNYKLAETYFQQSMLEGSEELRNIYETCQQKEIPYYGLCSEFSKALERMNSEEPACDRAAALKIQNLENIISDKNIEIIELNHMLEERIPKEDFDILLRRHQSLQNIYQELNEKHKTLEAKHKELGEEFSRLKYRYDKQKIELDNQQVSIQDLESQVEILKQQNSASHDNYQVVQGRIKSLKDIMDQVIVRLTLIKRDIEKLRVQNEDLTEENRKLHIRAAGGFEELTPRPNYKKIMEDSLLDFNIFNPTGKKPLRSTVDITTGLLEKVQFLQDKVRNHASGNSRKGNQTTRMFVTRNESGGTDPQSAFSGFGSDGTPRIFKGSQKKEKFGKPLKINILTTQQMNNSMRETSENNSMISSRRGSQVSSKRASLSFVTPDPKKNDDNSPFSNADDLSTAAVPNNKYAKSTFSTLKQPESGHRSPYPSPSPRNTVNEFGTEALKETQELLSHVAQAKLDLKDLDLE